MEVIHILIIDIFSIILGIVGLWKIPLSALFGVLISITVLFYQIIDVGFTDIGFRMFTILTVVICATCLIGGYDKNG